ncbi:hypothetical protein [Endozoicomonas sp. OPT23]|uniref:hypothetical protein n=1 Tax=Endozoicomonas sp. OPT23 TaxID=2072845 RepID=UPI0018912EB2|nr:hypothetical protein [Endozoicomonas sp. OPT23]
MKRRSAAPHPSAQKTLKISEDKTTRFEELYKELSDYNLRPDKRELWDSLHYGMATAMDMAKFKDDYDKLRDHVRPGVQDVMKRLKSLYKSAGISEETLDFSKLACSQVSSDSATSVVTPAVTSGVSSNPKPLLSRFNVFDPFGWNNRLNKPALSGETILTAPPVKIQILNTSIATPGLISEQEPVFEKVIQPKVSIEAVPVKKEGDQKTIDSTLESSLHDLMETSIKQEIVVEEVVVEEAVVKEVAVKEVVVEEMLVEQEITIQSSDSPFQIREPVQKEKSQSLAESTPELMEVEPESLEVSLPRKVFDQMLDARIPTFRSTVSPYTCVGLENPYGKQCYINSGIQLLRVILTEEQKTQLAKQWLGNKAEQNSKEPSSVVDAFAQLLITMESSPDKKKLIAEHRNYLVELCFFDEHFKGVMQQKGGTSRALERPTFSPERLVQNDSSEFFWKLQEVIGKRVSVKNDLEEMVTLTTEVKGDVISRAGEIVKQGVLVLALPESGNVQQAITHYLRPEKLEEKAVWPEGTYLSDSDEATVLEKEESLKTEKNKQFRIKEDVQCFQVALTSEFERMQTLRSKSDWQKGLFESIKLPVHDSNTEEAGDLIGTPEAMIVYYGSSLSGHYVCLNKSFDGWLVQEDSKKGFIESNPARFLIRKKMVPCLIHYRVDKK